MQSSGIIEKLSTRVLQRFKIRIHRYSLNSASDVLQVNNDDAITPTADYDVIPGKKYLKFQVSKARALLDTSCVKKVYHDFHIQ